MNFRSKLSQKGKKKSHLIPRCILDLFKMHPLSFWDRVSYSLGWPPIPCIAGVTNVYKGVCLRLRSIPYVARVTSVCPCLFAMGFCVSVFSVLVIKPNASFTQVINSTTAPALAGTLRAAKRIASQHLEQHISLFIPRDTCPRSFLSCIMFHYSWN